MDPGLIAALIWGGAPGIALAGVGSFALARVIRATRIDRMTAKAIRTAKWTTFTEHKEGGTVVVSIRRKVLNGVLDSEHIRTVAADEDRLEIDVARWEAKQRAAERNEEDGLA